MIVAVLEREEGLSALHTAGGKLQHIALARLREKYDLDEIRTSIRFLFYELEQASQLSKRVINLDGTEGKRKPAQNLTDAVTRLRETGLVPWDWIVDDSRSVSGWRSAATVRDFVLESLDRARLDPWQGGVRPVILTESRTIGGVLARGIARDYLVDVAPTGGQARGFLINEVVPLFTDPNAKPLYLGDHDLAGNHIETHTRRTIEDHLGRALDWERVALTDALEAPRRQADQEK
jgi:hypothetical protein